MNKTMENYDLKLTFVDSSEFIQTNSQFLSSQSEVFHQMISGDSPKTEIKISNARPSIVFDALKCLHTLGRSINSLLQAILIRVFARSYKMRNLYLLCETFIEKNLNTANIGEVHDLACHHKDLEIQYLCWRKFDMSWREIFTNPFFYKCGSATILRCVSRPVYHDMEEFYLWIAVCAWGLNKINCHTDTGKEKLLREAIIEYLPYIRFLVMKEEELEEVFKSNILTSTECDAIRKAYTNFDVTKLPETICRETTPRRTAFVSKYISHIDYFYCPKHSLLRSIKAGDTFYAEFTVKKDCFLRAFLLPLRGFTEPLSGTLEMLKVHNGKNWNAIDGARTFKLLSHVIKFNPPLFIEENCTIYMNAVIMENNLFCEIEPYANCNIGRTNRKKCEEMEEWKSFYINDVVLYF